LRTDNYLGLRCTRDLRFRITMAKAVFNKKKALFTSKLALHFRTKLVKCYIWGTALYGAETRTFRKVYQKYPESFGMWFWRRVEKNQLD